MVGRIIIGVLIAAAGFMIVWKTDYVYRAIGRLPIGEKIFGSGGTRSLLKVIGVLIIFIGFSVMTKLHEKIIEAVFGRLFQ